MHLIASIKPKMHVKIGILAFGLIPISVAAACSTNVAASTKARDDSFTVGESRKIVVNGSNGRINVSAGTDDTVRVKATLRRPDDLKYEVAQDGNTINIEVEEKAADFLSWARAPATTSKSQRHQTREWDSAPATGQSSFTACIGQAL